MKVIAIDTSPERERGVISLPPEPFLDSIREAGADVELFYTRDGMQWPGQQTRQADVLVPASSCSWSL